MSKFSALTLFFLLCPAAILCAEDGYALWLRYKPVSNAQAMKSYRDGVRFWMVDNPSPTAEVARKELTLALEGMLGVAVPEVNKFQRSGTLIATTYGSALARQAGLKGTAVKDGEGYGLFSVDIDGKKAILIAGESERGMLYGVFHFLRLIQTHQSIANLSLENSPRTRVRILNHWDNLDRTVERGYAGFSLWDWHKLPEYIDPRYHDYARANASIGINGTVLTNVNANALILTTMYLRKVKALADVFRPYGIKVYLTARFSAPIEIGGLKTADPLNAEVQQWWKDKVKEIYEWVPDFGGFTVKANSEGQPGPQNYGRNHADGANLLADALEPFGGIVMWRAFVYDNEVPVDRTKQAYDEFKPLDGKFRDNVMVQVKNGPLDFQPREPFHPLFGAMPATPLMMEFQITQEYLGQATHLVYMATLFEETLDADTYAKGKGSTVAKVVDGTLTGKALTGMAGVANIGNDRNWSGHPFGQSNWYAFGRLAWDHSLSSEQIADEWIRMTFGNDTAIVNTIRPVMMASREALVKYMTPLGLHHIMGWSHHFGPGPWIKDKHRDDWTSVYYHRADAQGIGFDRSSSGSNALEQYHPGVRRIYNDLATCPEQYLLWFHHVSWDHRMDSGRSLWEEMCFQYQAGVDSVKWMQEQWASLKGGIDGERHAHVQALLEIQLKEARWWRDACLLYFQTFSGKALPDYIPRPEHGLEYYQGLEFPFAPGIRPRW